MTERKQNDVIELGLVIVAALAPMWLMAGNLSDLDEVLKSGVGIACVGAVVTLYRTWKEKRDGGQGQSESGSGQ